MMYLATFLAALVVDLIPIMAPPAWTVMVLLLMKFHLNPWGVLLAGVPGSTLGRYIFSLYVVKVSDKLIKRHKREELEFLGKKLDQKLWVTWSFVFIYTLTPLSTTALFTAAGMAKVSPARTLPPFFLGKFLSDAVMIFAARYAASNLKGILKGAFSLKGILLMVFGLVVIGGVLFIDWRALLQRKKVRFNFNIWK
jgi:membrane protein DedA with SNARE-associated domain